MIALAPPGLPAGTSRLPHPGGTMPVLTVPTPMTAVSIVRSLRALGLRAESPYGHMVSAESADQRLRVEATLRPISAPPSWRVYLESPGATWSGYVTTLPELEALVRERAESVAELAVVALASLAPVGLGACA